MSEKVLVTASKLTDLADAIRSKSNNQNCLTIDEMTHEVTNELISIRPICALEDVVTYGPSGGSYTPTTMTLENVYGRSDYFVKIRGTTVCTKNSTTDYFEFQGRVSIPNNTSTLYTYDLDASVVIQGSGSAHSSKLHLGLEKIYIEYIADQGAEYCSSTLNIRYYDIPIIDTNGDHYIESMEFANIYVEPRIKSLTVTPTSQQQIFDATNEILSTTVTISNKGNNSAVSYSANFDFSKDIILSGSLYINSNGTAQDTTNLSGEATWLQYTRDGLKGIITKNNFTLIFTTTTITIQYTGSYSGTIYASDGNGNAILTIYQYPYSGYNTVTVEAATGTTPAAMTLPTSTSASATSGYTSKATISRSTSTQYLNIPPGYLNSGAYYTISATPNGTATSASSITATGASVSTGTNTLTLSKTVSNTPRITTAGYISAGTAGNSSVSLTASVTTKAAATITPGTSNQTIASGTYLTGTQTISGDANLVGSNIISGKSIFGVSGTVVIQHYYTGSGTPSSSTGVNGDIYLKTS